MGGWGGWLGGGMDGCGRVAKQWGGQVLGWMGGWMGGCRVDRWIVGWMDT